MMEAKIILSIILRDFRFELRSVLRICACGWMTSLDIRCAQATLHPTHPNTTCASVQSWSSYHTALPEAEPGTQAWDDGAHLPA